MPIHRPVRLRRTLSVLLALGLAVTAPPPLASATDDETSAQSALAALAGSYEHAGGEQDHEGVLAAIERVVEPMSLLIRDIARVQIRANVRAEPRVVIETIDATHVRVTFGAWTSPTMSTDGTSRVVPGPDGTPTRFSVRYHDALLYTRAVTERGSREVWLSPDLATGRLRMQVRITAAQLPAPIDYALRYQRS